MAVMAVLLAALWDQRLLWGIWSRFLTAESCWTYRPVNLDCKSVEDHLPVFSADRRRKWSSWGVRFVVWNKAFSLQMVLNLTTWRLHTWTIKHAHSEYQKLKEATTAKKKLFSTGRQDFNLSCPQPPVNACSWQMWHLLEGNKQTLQQCQIYCQYVLLQQIYNLPIRLGLTFVLYLLSSQLR